MDIFYDHQIFSHQYGGIPRYFTELIRHLMHQDGTKVVVPVFYSNNQYLKEQDIVSFRKYFPNLHFKGKYALLKKLNNRITRRALRSMDYDLIHSTYYDPTLLPSMRRKPMICTIHDMTPELFPQNFRTNTNLVENKKKYVRAAKRIIAVSQNTKKDLLELYEGQIPEDRVDVIYHGIKPLDRDSLKDITMDLPDEYFLFVGKRFGYKNFNRLLESIKIFCEKHPKVHLVCAGGGPLKPEEQKLISSMNLESRIIHVFPSDPELHYLYKYALALVYPSFYEGFGLPILEAFMNDCPVLLSEASCFPEIAGSAGVYFDPHNTDEMADRMFELYSGRDQVLKEKVPLGRKRLEDFRIDDMVNATLQTYQKSV